MARTREFDLEATLDSAMHVFWRKGYAATSMADIYSATGLKPGSVYSAFRDKEGLFQQAFEAYAAKFRAGLPSRLRGVAAIRSWVGLQVSLAIDDSGRSGCMIINTVAERSAHSEASQAMAQGRMREIRDFFVRNLVIAVETQELSKDTDIDLRADALVGAVVAVMTLGRSGADSATIRNVGTAALETFATDS
jgi:TetR/AcrR family transcriptional regulator, transcriptional repressor for nem operon